MTFLSRFFFAISILLALAVAAVVFFVATFDANQYKPQISQLIKKSMGHDVELDGDISLSVYPDIALNVGSLKLNNPPGFGNKPFASVKSAKIGAKLMPLLKKQLIVEKVQLNSLRLDLHKKVNGQSNWSSFSGRDKEASKTSNKTLDELIKNLSVAGVGLTNATIRWRDDVVKQDITVSPLNVNTGVFRPGKPIDVKLDGSLQQKNPPFKASGQLSSTVTLTNNNTHFNLKNTQINATASGLPVSKVVLSGDIEGTAQRINIAGLKLNIVSDKSLLPKGQLQANLVGNAKMDVEQQVLQIGGMRVLANLSNLPNTGSTIKADVSGNASLNLKSQQLRISGMKLLSNNQQVIDVASQSTLVVNGDTQLDLSKLLLNINAMQLKANASKVLQGGGQVDATVSGSTQLDLNKMRLNIAAMKLNANAKGLPNIGNIQADVAGKLNAAINDQQLRLQNAKVNTVANGEILSGGKLSAQLSSSDLQANAKSQHIKLSGMNLNATVNGGMVPGGKLVHSSKGNIDVNLISHQGTANLNSIRLDMAGASLTGDAKLIRMSPQPTISGNFKTNQFQLKQVLSVLGIKLPITSNANVFGNTQASFQLTASPESINVKALNLALDQSKISGDVAVTNFKQPAIKTKLKVDQLNIDDYLQPVNPQQASKSGTDDKLLPIDLLKTLKLDGAISVGKLSFDGVDMTQVNAVVKAKNGVIDANPLSFNAFKGNYKGDLNIDVSSNTPKFRMQHQVQQVRSENVLLQFFQDRYVSGGVFLNTNLTTQGNTLNTIKQNLNGSADIEFREGTIRDSNLAKKIDLAVNAFEKHKKTAEGKEVVTFTKLAGDWKANRGVLSTDNMQLVAPHFLIGGKGSINIVRNELDLKLRLGSKNKDSKVFAPLHIYGPFDKLNYELELDVLLKSLAREELDKKKAEVQQRLQVEKQKAIRQLEEKKQAEIRKLQAKKAEAEKRLKAEQQKLQQRLAAEKQKAQQQLQNKLKQQQEKLTNKLSDKLKKDVEEKTGNATEDIKKNVEEQLKNKLKEGLKGLF